MKLRAFAILAILAAFFASCTDDPVSVGVDRDAELNRQVNWAAVNIGAIYNAVKMYRQDYGEDPSSVEELLELAYLEIAPPVRLWWEFEFTGSNPITAISAVSTGQMALGAGKCISFNTQTGMFEGELVEYLSPWIHLVFVDLPIYIHIGGGRIIISLQFTV